MTSPHGFVWYFRLPIMFGLCILGIALGACILLDIVEKQDEERPQLEEWKGPSYNGSVKFAQAIELPSQSFLDEFEWLWQQSSTAEDDVQEEMSFPLEWMGLDLRICPILEPPPAMLVT